MSSEMKEKSIQMRRAGFSVKEISERLSVSKGSVSTWVRNVILSKEQKIRLKNKNHSPEVIEKRRQSRLKNESSKKNFLIQEAAKEIGHIDQNMLLLIGIALYWGEGAKKTQGMARISNSDPHIIMVAMRFFREVCKVKESRFRAHIHIHSKSAVKEAERFWEKITGLPHAQFFKTYTVKSKSSKNIRKTLPYGTIDVGVGDTKLLLKILGWIEGIKKQL